jgi:hypothetical protein
MKEQLMKEIIESHEKINEVNEEIIKTQKEHIQFLRTSIDELKEIIQKYLLKNVEL